MTEVTVGLLMMGVGVIAFGGILGFSTCPGKTGYTPMGFWKNVLIFALAVLYEKGVGKAQPFLEARIPEKYLPLGYEDSLLIFGFITALALAVLALYLLEKWKGEETS
ncbi:MAG: hypothetical protein G01um101449_332 [Parcubacteria group bacterium Gr01-1014_49]|nr:MAG: hypothetical protein G01um101449_332 [Parcubacteria group bacterium Gr01-1014_49]